MFYQKAGKQMNPTIFEKPKNTCVKITHVKQLFWERVCNFYTRPSKFMTYKSQFGNLGEDLACEYLVNNNYKIIERNFRKPWGEIDIIAKSSDKVLIFIEVKTMEESLEGLKPEDQLTNSKLQKLKRTASLYAGHRQELVDDKKGWRIDLIAITINPAPLLRTQKWCWVKVNNELAEPLTIIDKGVIIKHYENIA